MYPVLKKGTRLRGFIDKNHRIRPYMENLNLKEGCSMNS